MGFLQECASLLDAGTPADDVLECMRQRFTTAGCMKVKTCLVRGMCMPSSEWKDECERRIGCAHTQGDADTAFMLSEHLAGRRVVQETDEERMRVATALADLPKKWPDNVWNLRVTAEETRECKRKAAVARVRKNAKRVRVRGTALLERAHRDLDEATTVVDLALALMLLTGRRTCEVLSGRATLGPCTESEYAATFEGQAKKKGSGVHEYLIPLLAPYDDVRRGWERLRELQNYTVLTREAASRRYQSALSRRLVARADAFHDVPCAHGLRGVYACMALRLFDWGDASDAYVAMCVLGHASLTDSLVYTACDVGLVEPHAFGMGVLTHHHTVA